MTYEREKFANDPERQARIQEIIGKEQLSPEELEEFIFLLWDMGKEEAGYNEEWILPNRDLPLAQNIKMYVGSPESHQVRISLLDRYEGKTQEIIRQVGEEDNLMWKIGLSGRYYSQFLGSQVDLLNRYGEILSDKPLDGNQLKGVAMVVWSAYGANSSATGVSAA